jgi:hypothetical protein
LTSSAKQQHRRRHALWTRAGHAVEAAGLPITTTITITWSACEVGERNDGHILGLPENERVNTVWDRLRRLATAYGAEAWIAARAPEYDREKRHHLHIGARIPAAADLHLIRTIGRLTGAPHEAIYTKPTSITRPGGRKCHGVIALGQLGAWMIQKNTRPWDGGSHGIMRYVTKAPRAVETSAQFRLSGDFLRIARAHGG